MQIEPDGFWLKMSVALWGLLTTVGGWVWYRLIKRMDDMGTQITVLQHDKMDQTDFVRYEERAERSRQEVRDSVVKLFDRIDDLKTLIVTTREKP